MGQVIRECLGDLFHLEDQWRPAQTEIVKSQTNVIEKIGSVTTYNVAHSSTSTVKAAGTDIASRTFWADEAAGSACAGHAFDALVTFVALGTWCSWLSIVAW